MSATNTPITTTTPRIHVDRTIENNEHVLQFEDTNGEPIAVYMAGEWLLFTEGDDDPFELGGTLDLSDEQVQALGREALAAEVA